MAAMVAVAARVEMAGVVVKQKGTEVVIVVVVVVLLVVQTAAANGAVMW